MVLTTTTASKTLSFCVLIVIHKPAPTLVRTLRNVRSFKHGSKKTRLVMPLEVLPHYLISNKVGQNAFSETYLITGIKCTISWFLLNPSFSQTFMKFSVGKRVSICACSVHSYKVSLLDCTALETIVPRAGNFEWYLNVVVGKQVLVPG